MQSEVPQSQAEHARESGTTQMKSAAVYCLSPSENIHMMFERLYHQRTCNKSLASFTHSHSWSDKQNESHLIFFVIHPCERIVVIGPYSSSADLRNKVIG